MFRQIIAATAVSLLATGALAQDDAGVNRAGTDAGSTLDANNPTTDLVTPNSDYESRFADYDRRIADYEARVTDYERRIRALEDDAGFERAGTDAGSTLEANNPTPSTLTPEAN